jgi:hypothetical protein
VSADLLLVAAQRREGVARPAIVVDVDRVLEVGLRALEVIELCAGVAAQGVAAYCLSSIARSALRNVTSCVCSNGSGRSDSATSTIPTAAVTASRVRLRAGADSIHANSAPNTSPPPCA